METITININKETKDIFKETVSREYGLGKGKLGKAVNEALMKWVEEKRQKEIADEMRAMMKKGFNMGKIKYKNRDELHER